MFYFRSKQRDDGCTMTSTVPGFLEGTPLEGGFRYWLGASGRSYLTRALPLAAVRDFAGAPVVLAGAAADGEPRPLWVGHAATAAFERAVAALGGGVEAHVHLLSETAADRRAVVADLCNGLGLTGEAASDQLAGCGIAA